MELRSLSMADAGGTSREMRRTEEAEGGGEWRGQGAGLGFSRLHAARALARWRTGEARGSHAALLSVPVSNSAANSNFLIPPQMYN